jgi:hypothetical protein
MCKEWNCDKCPYYDAYIPYWSEDGCPVETCEAGLDPEDGCHYPKWVKWILRKNQQRKDRKHEKYMERLLGQEVKKCGRRNKKRKRVSRH